MRTLTHSVAPSIAPTFRVSECVCVCVRERERAKEKKQTADQSKKPKAAIK